MKSIKKIMENNLKKGILFENDYESIEKILSKYINDSDFLRFFRSTGDGISLAIHTNYLTNINRTKNILQTFYKKLSLSPKNNDFLKQISLANSKLINFNNLQWTSQSIKDIIDFEDVYTSTRILFDRVNSTVEGIIKPLVDVFYYIETVNNKKIYNEKSLGNKISYLDTIYGFFCVNGIPVSQWRNISDHKDYYVKKNRIIGHYSNNKSFNYCLMTLIKVTNLITLLANALYIAFQLFLYNNTKLIKIKNIEFKQEIWMNNLEIALAAHNFLITKAENKDEFIVFIKDCCKIYQEDYIKERIIELSQYSLNFFCFINKDIEVIYHNYDGKALAKIKHKISDFIEMNKNKYDVSYMAERMIIEL